MFLEYPKVITFDSIHAVRCLLPLGPTYMTEMYSSQLSQSHCGQNLPSYQSCQAGCYDSCCAVTRDMIVRWIAKQHSSFLGHCTV